MPKLRLDWATYEAATHACRAWHYSRCVPTGGLVKIGVWEDDRFIGVVIYSRGAGPQIGCPFGLPQTQVCELARVALRDHATPVSRIIAISLKFLREVAPGMRLIVSFSDTDQGHHGGIYQAGGWVFAGVADARKYIIVKGETRHSKTVANLYGSNGIAYLRARVDPNARPAETGPKYRYLKPLDAAMAAQIAPLAQPYPKRAKQATTGDQPGGGGATPTRALQTERGVDDSPRTDAETHQAAEA